MWEVTQARLRAVVVVAPFIPMFGFVYFHAGMPENAYDPEAGWAMRAADPERQWWSFLFMAIWMGLSVLQIVAIRSYLRSAGENLWSFLAVPLITLGSALTIFVFASEAGMLVAVEAGASVEAVWDTAWNTDFGINVYLGMLPLSFLGTICLLVGLWRSHVLSRAMTWVVVFGAVAGPVMGGAPVGWVLQLIPLANALVFLPIAYQMWVDSPKAAVADPTAQA